MKFYFLAVNNLLEKSFMKTKKTLNKFDGDCFLLFSMTHLQNMCFLHFYAKGICVHARNVG